MLSAEAESGHTLHKILQCFELVLVIRDFGQFYGHKF